ncbi:MAG: hypothetical protein WCI20_02355 [bacterium]
MAMNLTGLYGITVVASLLGAGVTGTVASAETLSKMAESAVFSSQFRPFSKTSPWNTPVPTNALVDPDSEKMIVMLSSNAMSLSANIRKWTVPVFTIDSARSPRLNVRTTSSCLNPRVDPDGHNIAENLPIPVDVWPDPSEDGHMVLVDISKRMCWDYARFVRLSSTVVTASRIDIWELDGPGYREPFAGSNWWTCGARGSGTPLLGGLIRTEEVQAGVIRHALAFGCPVNRRSVSPDTKEELCSPPAQRTDGEGIGAQYIPEGARLQLDPALDLQTLKLSPGTLVIARALQVYGMFNVDNASTCSLYFQNVGADGGRWNQIGTFMDMHNIPLNRFRVLKCEIVVRK